MKLIVMLILQLALSEISGESFFLVFTTPN